MIGKWNKSVILSYIGLSISILGIFIVFNNINLKYAQICLMFAGICDLFDGTIARMCKRTEEEKLFGIQLDSLVDVVNFLVFPVIIAFGIGLNRLYVVPAYILYIIFGIARLAHFNITSDNSNKPRKYYEGLPVTTSAILFPNIYLLSYILEQNIFNTVYLTTICVTAILFVSKIKVPKPKKVLSFCLLLSAIILSILYLVIL